MIYKLMIGLCMSLLFGLSGCTTEKTGTTSTEPNDGASAHQDAWNQGQIPRELEKNTKSLTPIPAEQTTTGTTAKTGEIENSQ